VRLVGLAVRACWVWHTCWRGAVLGACDVPGRASGVAALCAALHAFDGRLACFCDTWGRVIGAAGTCGWRMWRVRVQVVRFAGTDASYLVYCRLLLGLGLRFTPLCLLHELELEQAAGEVGLRRCCGR
jgi:hypothetical protein